MPSTHTNLTYHLIFSTKDREPFIAPSWQERLHATLAESTRRCGGVPLEIGGVHDQVHMLVGLKATHCIAGFLREIKRASSLWVHDALSMPSFEWQVGYGAFSVSAYRMDALRAYIRTQQEHHRAFTYKDEYRSLIVEHGIVFDERYLW